MKQVLKVSAGFALTLGSSFFISSLASAGITLLVPSSFQRLPVEPRLLSGRTPFGDVVERYESGTNVSVREVRGWYAGRCYYADSPTHAVAALLVVEPGLNRKANGPGFDAAEYRRVTPLVSTKVVPDYFDSLDDKKRNEVKNALVRYQDVNAYPVNSNNALVVEGMRTVDFESRNYELRRSDKYLAMRLSCTETSYCLNYRNESPDSRVVATSGEAPAYCYYFKRLKK